MIWEKRWVDDGRHRQNLWETSDWTGGSWGAHMPCVAEDVVRGSAKGKRMYLYLGERSKHVAQALSSMGGFGAGATRRLIPMTVEEIARPIGVAGLVGGRSHP